MFRLFSSSRSSHESDTGSEPTSPELFRKFKSQWEGVIKESRNSSLWDSDITYTDIPYSLDVMIDCLSKEQAMLNEPATARIGDCAEFLFEENVIARLMTLSQNDIPRGYENVALKFLGRLVKECDSNLLLNAAVHVPITSLMESLSATNSRLEEFSDGLLDLECNIIEKMRDDPLLFSIFVVIDEDASGQLVTSFRILEHLITQLGTTSTQMSRIIHVITSIVPALRIHAEGLLWNEGWIDPACDAFSSCLQQSLIIQTKEGDQLQTLDKICKLLCWICENSFRHSPDPQIIIERLINVIESSHRPAVSEDSNIKHVVVLRVIHVLFMQEWPENMFTALLNWLLGHADVRDSNSEGRLTPLQPFFSIRDWFMSRIHSQNPDIRLVALKTLLYCMDKSKIETFQLLFSLPDVDTHFPRLPSPPIESRKSTEHAPQLQFLASFGDFLQLLNHDMFDLLSIQTYLDECMFPKSNSVFVALPMNLSASHLFFEELLDDLSSLFEHSPEINLVLTGILTVSLSVLVHSPDVGKFLGSSLQQSEDSGLSLYTVLSSLRDHILALRLHTRAEAFDSGYKNVRKACYDRGVLDLPQGTSEGATKLVQFYKNMVIYEEFVKEISSIILIESVK